MFEKRNIISEPRISTYIIYLHLITYTKQEDIFVSIKENKAAK